MFLDGLIDLFFIQYFIVNDCPQVEFNLSWLIAEASLCEHLIFTPS